MDEEDAIALLRTLLPPGKTVYTILRHTSRSGETKVIDLVTVSGEEIVSIGTMVATALYRRFDTTSRRAGIVCRGVGMDLGNSLVYEISYLLYGAGLLKQEWL